MILLTTLLTRMTILLTRMTTLLTRMTTLLTRMTNRCGMCDLPGLEPYECWDECQASHTIVGKVAPQPLDIDLLGRQI